ncbi:hypothetical protein JOL62DRAFT_150077 [Phyllosticta paracitricarpa]|uniref:Uncharacterized protein n=1 Tax=Phyllosticta paracitricarpa TaxID=2016321 RepID=A0ABR1N7E5_9PEZI
MDVCKWLEETVGPGPPATLTLPPGRDAREKPVQQNDRTSSHQTRRCNHLFSDSSLLQVARLDNVQGLSAHKPDHVGRPPRQSLEEDRPTTVPSDASDPQQHEGPDLYARRPRRKTRPEIYEPKLGGDREMAKQTRQKEKEGQGKKGSKPKPRRKAAKDRQSHHAHAFQATNVTKERLTMKPNQSIGLFKKGRASTPVKGRGLPDLIFSEMRFLQKQDDTRDQAQEETRNKRKRKDPTQAQGQEISAYFGAKRPPLADKHRQRPSGHRSKSASLRQRCPSRTSTRFESAKPTIELPDKPHLGFGSRVVDPVASDPTYYTPWSESVRDASHQEYKPSDAPLPPMQSSLRPHKQSTKARGSVGGHPGRDTGASGEGERSQQASQVAMRSTSGRSHNSRGIPHNVEHRERDSTPKGIAERLVPSTSNQSTVPEHEPRLGKGSPRFNGQLDESVLTAKSEEEKVDGAVNTAGKQHEPSRRPVFDRDVPDCRVEKSKMRTDYAMFLDADSNENDHAKAKVSTSPRSSSPLGLLLRNCENACNDSCLDRDSPLEAGPVSKSLAVVRDGLACQLDEVYRPSMPQRWASGAVRGRPSFYERQWSGNGVEEVPCENLEDDVDMGNHANLIENAYADIEFGEIRGWTDDGLDMPGVRNEAYDGGFEGSPGPTADEVVASTRAAIGGQGEWTWRRHKLY